MGNSETALLKAAVEQGDEDALGKILSPETSLLLQRPLNRKGDTALMLSMRRGHYHLADRLLLAGSDVTCQNYSKQTALDIVLNNILPEDCDILHEHFCPFVHQEETTLELPDVVRTLLRSGAVGNSLQRLVLHKVRDESLIGELCDLLPDLNKPQFCKIAGLILQVSLWFSHNGNVEKLLQKGVKMQYFWRTPFVPRIIPYAGSLRRFHWPSAEQEDGEYTFPVIPESEAIQNLKLSFIQDWRADWNDGENPSAQFRAGLQLPPDGAELFVKGANSYGLLELVMRDVMNYLPEVCNGPQLRDRALLRLLTLAGYKYTQMEQQHLFLKFGFNFQYYQSYIQEPQPLCHIARVCVRFQFRESVFCAKEKLTFLPVQIREYLIFSDIKS